MEIKSMLSRRKKKKVIKEMTARFFLILFSLIFIFPFFWMVSTSLKPDYQIFQFPPVWIPDPVQWSNYPEALTYFPFFQQLRNTMYMVGMSVLGTLFACPLVAYSFSRIRWPGRDALFIILLTTMMLPFQVRMIPLFILFIKIGWVGTFKPLWIPWWTGNVLYVFLLRQFFFTIPNELSDSAKIDGYSEFGVFLHIIVPLAKPALFMAVLFTFLTQWNDFLGPLIYLNDKSMYTLSIGLRWFYSAYQTEWAMLMTASTVVVIPILIMFFFTQRTFIEGITLTGIKG